MRWIILVAGIALVGAMPGFAAEFGATDGIEVPSAEHITGPAAERSECGGTAPGATQCTTSFHLRTAGVSHGIVLPLPGYTGTMETKLAWPSEAAQAGARVFRCNVNNGVFLGCLPGSGEFPPQGMLMEHVCRSYNLGTTTPGGTGTWRCQITH